MTCASDVARCTLVIINLPFMLSGVCLLATGILILSGFHKVIQIVDVFDSPLAGTISAVAEYVDSGSGLSPAATSYVHQWAVQLCFAGTAIIITCLLGCCGSTKRCSCYLVIYAVCIAAIVFTQIVGIAYFIISKHQVESTVQAEMLNSIVHNYDGGLDLNDNRQLVLSKDAVTFIWDAIHIKCQCCGVNGRHDFDNATKWHRVIDSLLVPGNVTGEADMQHIPLSCCSLLNHTASSFPANVSRLLFTNLTVCQLTGSPAVTHTAGCFSTIRTLLFSKFMYIIIGCIAAIFLIEITAFASAVTTTRAVERSGAV